MALDDGGPSGRPELKHDFLVIWLAMSTPVLTELSDTAFPGYDVGDPLGDGNFAPIDGDYLNGLIRVVVTGSFVDLDGDSYTLPSGWAALAGVYAADTDDYNPMRWDIHDDQLETEEHTALSICGGLALIDAVDNCLGGGELGEFSRLIGGTVDTEGPFDPVRPGSTFLPDGNLNAGDAPMPAARIDVELDGTVGSLEAADKHVLYSRNRTGEASTAFPNNAHNLYAPFYASYIPATGADETSSGTHGAIANNFPGYQGEEDLYHFWDLLNTGDPRSGDNECRDVGGTGQFGDGTFIPLPSGFDHATVYTDEHGEAILQFNPDVGAELEADLQGLCDLGEGTAPELLGSAVISAVAKDPFQLTRIRRPGNTLTKNVFELASKSLDCFPKTPIAAICIETITDIRGNPVVGAPGVFTADADKGDPNVIGFTGVFGGFEGFAGQCPVSPGTTFGVVEGTLCLTNEDGQAAVEVVSTQRGAEVDVLAENIATRRFGFGILRDRCVKYAGDGVTLPTDGPNCVTPTDGGPVLPPAPPTSGSNSPTPTPQAVSNVAAQVVSLAGAPIPAAAPAAKAKAKLAKKASLRAAKLVVVKGKRYLVVRANGATKTAKLRIQLVMGTGKVSKPIVRTIRTNRMVRVSKLVISKHVRTVRVSVIR
jgi:hypothetical protein